jgi:adenylate kinase family enzyme
MRRVVVVGTSGSGKSTLAADLAQRLGVPWIELDAIFHQPGWTQLPETEFRRRVAEAVAVEGWVVDGNYSVVSDIVFGAADSIVWLDLPRTTVTWRVVRRTVARAVTRRTLWNGNRERLRQALSLHDPERSIVAWAWTRHPVQRRRYAAMMADPAWGHLSFIRLRGPGEVAAFLAGFPEPPAEPARAVGGGQT